MPQAVRTDDSNLQHVGEWLAARGLNARDARDRLAAGKVWDAATPVTDLRRAVSQSLRLEDSRPRFNPHLQPAVVSRDTSYCIIYKPSGVLAVPAPGRRETSVLSEVRRWFGNALAVHRIDEGTSGLLCVALQERAQLDLKAQFEAHSISRRYIAWVRGRFSSGERVVETGLVRDRGDGLRGVVALGHPDAKPARTTFRLLEARGGGSLVEAELTTGRTHQVRLHLAHLGHAILGDPLYGRARAPRLMLHATHLGLRCPATGVRRTWDSPLPDDFLAVSNA